MHGRAESLLQCADAGRESEPLRYFGRCTHRRAAPPLTPSNMASSRSAHCCSVGTSTMAAGASTTASVLALFARLPSPPPETFATLVMDAGALAATFTVSRIDG